MFRNQCTATRFACWCLYLLSPAVTLAQFNSNVQGTITDPNGATVANATIRLQNTETGADLTTRPDSGGFYRFTSIIPGAYRVVVEAPGFARTEVATTVTTDQTAGVDVKLTLANTTTQITVNEVAAGLNPDETRLQVTLSSKELVALPLQNRGTLNVVKTAPGVNGIVENEDNVPIGRDQPSVQANGRPSSSNLYLFDGLPLVSNIDLGSLNIIPNPDMLREAALQTTTFSVENGASSSLQVDFSTKSGSNQFHGDGDWTYTNKALSAVPTFTSSLAPFRKQWFSGALGGPIIKNRTFFFGSFQNRNQAQSLSGQDFVETDQFVAWAKQAFPNSKNVNSLLIPFRPTQVQFQKVSQYASDIYPQTCGTPAAYNIPCNLPVQEQGLFTQSPTIRGTQYNVRLDQYFNDAKDRLFGSYFRVDQHSDYLADRPLWDSQTPGASFYASASWTHQFSATLLNQASFGWTRTAFEFGGGGNLAFVTVPAGVTICCQNGFFGFFPPFSPTADKEHSYTFRDYASWVKGSHTVRLGTVIAHQDYWQDRAGEYARPFNVSYNSIFDFLNDKPSAMALYTLSAQTGKFQAQYYGAQTTRPSIYVQDEWKVKPSLLLSLGLRWDDYGNPTPYGFGALPYVQVFPGAGSNFQQQIANAFTKFSSAAFAGRQNKNFLPRVGVAWSPDRDRKWSIRGGAGLYEDGISLANVTANLPTQPPNRVTLNLSQFSPNLPAPYTTYGTNTQGPPWGFTYPTLNLQGIDSRGAVIGIPAGISGIDAHLTPQKTVLYNLGVQRELPGRLVVGATFVGSHSWDLFYNPNYNSFAGDLLNGTLDRLTSEWGGIRYMRNGLASNYNGLVITAQQNKGPLTWQASYTWSHTLADGALNLGDAVNAYQPHAYYASTNYDVRHRLSLSAIYQLPAPAQPWLKPVLGGWQISAIAILQSGTPFTVYNSASYASGGDYNADGNNLDLPNVAAGTQLTGFTRTQYENGVIGKASITAPVGYQTAPVEGNSPPNMFRNPGYATLDSGVNKRIALPWFGSENSTLILRGDIFNTLNRVNLQAVDGNLNDNTFGRSSSAYQGRVVQVGARFEF